MKVQRNDNSWEHLKLSADHKSAIGYDRGKQISEYPDIDQTWLQRASSRAFIGRRCTGFLGARNESNGSGGGRFSFEPPLSNVPLDSRLVAKDALCLPHAFGQSLLCLSDSAISEDVLGNFLPDVERLRRREKGRARRQMQGRSRLQRTLHFVSLAKLLGFSTNPAGFV
jgi:hypothetical protein